MRSSSRSLSALLALVVLAVPACSTTGDDATATALQAELDKTRAEQQELSERVAELEAALAPDDGATEDPFADLDQRIDELDEALEELVAQLRAETEARGAAVSGVAGEVDELDARIAELQASVVELRGAVQELTDEIASLEAQFKAHRDDDGRHR